MQEHFQLDPALTFLNHGSFGACPRAVLEHQTQIRAQLEASPVQFMLRALPERLAAARGAVAAFVGAQPEDLVFVRNATEGVGAVLRSLSFAPGDELLTSNHAYVACSHTLRFVAERSGARVVVVDVPFPVESAEQVTSRFCRAVTSRTRIALIDHVTSITGLVFPVRDIIRELTARGVRCLVDGAHAPGMVEVDLAALGADYYAANFHKWVCAPKGAGMLWVRPELQAEIYPPVISHGYAAAPEARFRAMFDWVGTTDPSAVLCVPFALELLASLVPGGWPELRARNHALAIEAREILCRALGVPAPAPVDMLGSLASVPLPGLAPDHAEGQDRLYAELTGRGFEVLVQHWPAPGRRVLRVSAQLYNSRDQYQRLAQVLPELWSATTVAEA